MGMPFEGVAPGSLLVMEVGRYEVGIMFFGTYEAGRMFSAAWVT